MSIYITPQDELHVEYQGIALTCPHCRTLTHLTPVAVPKFDDLSHRKPKQIGIVFRCDACGEPVFLKFQVKGYTALRVELAPDFAEVERAPENFPLTYLPPEAESLFREALGCHAAGFFDAFGSMCRRTAQSLFRELGERGKLELFDTLQEIRTLAELDDDIFAEVRGVLFGSDSDPWPNHPRSRRRERRDPDRGHARPVLSDLRAQGAAHAGDESAQIRARRAHRDGRDQSGAHLGTATEAAGASGLAPA